MDLEVPQLLVGSQTTYDAPLAGREVLHPRDAEYVAAPPVATEQHCRPYIELDITRDDQPELILMVGNSGRKPGVHAASSAPELQSIIQGL
jgi:hypothetical protein